MNLIPVRICKLYRKILNTYLFKARTAEVALRVVDGWDKRCIGAEGLIVERRQWPDRPNTMQLN